MARYKRAQRFFIVVAPADADRLRRLAGKDRISRFLRATVNDYLDDLGLPPLRPINAIGRPAPAPHG